MPSTANHLNPIVQQPQQRHAQIVRWWQHGSISPILCHFGSISRASRRYKMPIQRFPGSFTPDNSAEVLQNVQKMQL